MRAFAYKLAWRMVYSCEHPKARLPENSVSEPEPFHFAVSCPEDDLDLHECISQRMFQAGAEGQPNFSTCPEHQCDAQAIGKFAKFSYLPEVLPIDVQYITGERANFQNKVKVPEGLDLSLLCDRDDDKEYSKYKLQAMVYYSGMEFGESTRGHYISYIRRGDAAGFTRLDDNDAALKVLSNKRRKGERQAEDKSLESITREEKFQPRILFYVKIRPPRPAPLSLSEADREAAVPAAEEAAEAARQRVTQARQARDAMGLREITAARDQRRDGAASYMDRVINVRFEPTRYRGATQSASTQLQGRCNCGRPGAQGLRGGGHQRAPRDGGKRGKRRSGDKDQSQRAQEDDKVEETEELASDAGTENSDETESSDDWISVHQRGGNGDNDANDGDDNDDEEAEGELLWPRFPDITAEDEDLHNAESWTWDHFISEYKKVFGKEPKPTRKASERTNPPKPVANLRAFFDRTLPQNWEASALKFLQAAAKDRRVAVTGPRTRLATYHEPLRYWDSGHRVPKKTKGGEKQKKQREQEVDDGGEGSQQEPDDSEAEADQDLVEGITRLEDLITELQAKACVCPLNGQTSLPVEGMRNGRGVPHRALFVRVSHPDSNNEEGSTRTQDDWVIPLAPELANRQNMTLDASLYVGHPVAGSQARTVRIELGGPNEDAQPSGPEEGSGSRPARIPEFMNWVEFEVDFQLEARHIQVETWVADMPMVPLRRARREPGAQARGRGSSEGGGGGGGGRRRRSDDGDGDDDDDDDNSGGDPKRPTTGQTKDVHSKESTGGASSNESGQRKESQPPPSDTQKPEGQPEEATEKPASQGTGNEDESTNIGGEQLPAPKDQQGKVSTGGNTGQDPDWSSDPVFNVENVDLTLEAGKIAGGATFNPQTPRNQTPQAQPVTGSGQLPTMKQKSLNWPKYSQSIRGETGSAKTGGNNKRTATAAEMSDDDSNSSRPRLESHSDDDEITFSWDSPSFNFGTHQLSHISTPIGRAVKKYTAQSPADEESLKEIDSQLSLMDSGQRPRPSRPGS